MAERESDPPVVRTGDVVRDGFPGGWHEKPRAEDFADATRNVVGKVLMGFDVRDDQVTLRFGGGKELIAEQYDGRFYVHYCGPVPSIRR